MTKRASLVKISGMCLCSVVDDPKQRGRTILSFPCVPFFKECSVNAECGLWHAQLGISYRGLRRSAHADDRNGWRLRPGLQWLRRGRGFVSTPGCSAAGDSRKRSRAHSKSNVGFVVLFSNFAVHVSFILDCYIYSLHIRQ